jgi:hypothetical protein
MSMKEFDAGILQVFGVGFVVLEEPMAGEGKFRRLQLRV